ITSWLPRLRTPTEVRLRHIAALIRLGAGELHHLGPLLSFGGDEGAEIAGRAAAPTDAQFGKPRFDFGIAQRVINLLVEKRDDLGPRILRRRDAIPADGLEAG